MTTIAIAIAMFIAIPVAVMASDPFDDVPEDNVFHDDIVWLADAGITKGCNPPANTDFCPGDGVTREQMSAFMRRLAQFLGAEDGTPAQADNATTADSAAKADDSDLLEGKTSAELVPLVFAQEDADGSGTSVVASGPVEVNSVTVDAPTDGLLVITGHVFVNNADAGQVDITLDPKVDGVFVTPMQWAAFMDSGADATGPAELFSLSYTVTTEVTAGTHTVTQDVGPDFGTADFFYNAHYLTVVFYPSGQGTITSAPSVAGAGTTSSPTGE